MIYYLQLKTFGLKIKITRIDLKRLRLSVVAGKRVVTRGLSVFGIEY